MNTCQNGTIEPYLKLSNSSSYLFFIPDLILMDVSLSHSVYQGKSVDGIKITQLLKADPQTASLPIILLPARMIAGDRETLLDRSGADSLISKPVVDHQDFVNQIKALLPD